MIVEISCAFIHLKTMPAPTKVSQQESVPNSRMQTLFDKSSTTKMCIQETVVHEFDPNLTLSQRMQGSNTSPGALAGHG